MQEIIDNSDLRRYRTELPNMCDDDLDPYQYRLYAHYKRWCGANGGACSESVRQTAKTCRMSTTKVINTRQWLHENGWISLDQNPITGAYTIQIADRWPENFMRYAVKSVPYLEQSPPKGAKSVPNMERSPSNSAESVPNMEQSVPNMEHKKEPKKELLEGTEEEGAAAPATAAAEPTPSAWYEAEPQPEPQAPAPAPTVKGMTAAPVIAMYRDAFLRYPSKPQMAYLLAAGVTDLRRWQDVLTVWVGKGWSPVNLAGMIDLYQNPERIRELTSYRPAAAPPPAKSAERVAPGWNEWLEELNPTGARSL